jgi:ethanolamine utilization protein EutP (predicted NTPase)
MSNLELVVELVFDNTEAFKNLSAKQTMNLLLTSKQAHENKNIQHARLQYNARYYARDMYYSVLETLEDACYFMSISRNTDACRERYHALFNEATNMIGIISEYCQNDAHIRECLEMLIMAGYKEILYYRLYKSEPFITYKVETFYRSYFFEKLAICNKFTHVHNPSHYVFDEDEYYEFHEIEKEQQKNMVEIYRDAIFGDESDYDEEDML